jgi:serralysin
MDRLDGGMGDDRLFGGDQADTLMGADGNDHLQEDAGHGMLEGGKGDDVFSGGEGADAFIVAPDSGNDVVLDFQARGDAQGAFDHVALRDISPDDVTVTDTDRGALVSWDVEGVEGSIRLEGVAKADLRQSDFMFVEAPGFVDGIDDDGSWYIFPSSDWIL